MEECYWDEPKAIVEEREHLRRQRTKEAIEEDEICNQLAGILRAYRTDGKRPTATELAINAIKILYKWRKEWIRERSGE